MTATYTGPSNSDADAVRFRLGDTDTDAAYLTDAEVAYCLTAEGDDVTRAALRACDAIVAKLSRDPDASLPGSSVSWSQRVEHFRQLRADLQREATADGAVLSFAGGQTYSDRDTLGSNTDLVPARIRRGADDNQSVNHPDAVPPWVR